MGNLISLVSSLLIAYTCLSSARELLAEDSSTALRIGAVLPLTGDFASYGSVIRDGIELAKGDLADEGILLTTFYEDSPTPGTSAITAARKLLEETQIQGLAGNFFNPNMTTMAPLLRQHGIPAFHTAIVDDTILDLGPAFFSTNATVEDEAKQIAHYLGDVIGVKKVSILYAGTQWGESYDRLLRRHLPVHGAEVLSSQLISIESRDMRAELLKIRSNGAEAIVLALFGPQLGIAISQARDLQIKLPLAATYETQDSSVIASARGTGQPVTFFVPEPMTDSPTRRTFRDSFKKKFGYWPPVLAANAYDSTVLLAKALNRCNASPKCAIETLSQNSYVDGASGTYKFFGRFGGKEFIEKVLWRSKIFVRSTSSDS